MDTIQPHEVTSVHAIYLDCCLPSFFNGAGEPVTEILAVPVQHNTTYRQAYQAAKDTFHMSSGWFDQVAGSGTLVEDALRSMFGATLNGDTNKVADFTRYIDPPECDENGDYQDGPDGFETVYLYIGLIPEKD